MSKNSILICPAKGENENQAEGRRIKIKKEGKKSTFNAQLDAFAKDSVQSNNVKD